MHTTALDDALKDLRATIAAAPNGDLTHAHQAADALAQAHTGDRWLLARIGGAFDASGHEATACAWYERALEDGFDALPADQAPHVCVWYGSTLRNVGRLADSERVLRDGLAQWPRCAALNFFLALTLMSRGRAMHAIVALAELHTGDWDDSLTEYTRAVDSYLAEELRPAAARLSPGRTRMVVADVQESAAWYTRALKTAPLTLDDRFASFNLGSGVFELVQADAKNPLSAGGSIPYWNAAPLDAWIEHATALGATLYRGPLAIPEEGLTICQLRDPFGGVFGLQEASAS